MRLHAQFFRWTKNPRANDIYLVEALGSDGVMWLDARKSMSRAHSAARDTCKKRGYHAYQLMRGDSFMTARPCSPMKTLTLGHAPLDYLELVK